MINEKADIIYRIVDTNLSGKRTALDIDGNRLPNNIQTEQGTQREWHKVSIIETKESGAFGERRIVLENLLDILSEVDKKT